jgi:hypothetical protein
VFVFESSGDAATRAAVAACLGRWHLYGLPLAGWAKVLYGDSAFTCPFRREEGFGEIAVNLPCQVDRQPKEGEYDVA